MVEPRIPQSVQSPQYNNRLSEKDKSASSKVAKEFEAYFMAHMLKESWKEMKPDSMFGGGYSEEIFRDMLLDEYGKIIAERGEGRGVSSAIEKHLGRQMIAIQENAQGNMR